LNSCILTGLIVLTEVLKPAAVAAQRLDRSITEVLDDQLRSFIKIRINGEWHDFQVERDIQPSDSLAYLLREKLGLTGLKVACDEGACGACSVIMDGKLVLSCMTLAVEANGYEVLTIEGLEKDDPVVEAFAEQSEPGYGTALQCGHCTPGFVMAAKALLNVNPRPTLDEVREALSGNICRCGCYAAIAQAVLHASDKIAERASKR
jgi:carbon-monoxide dehydrogenase small subunit